MITAGAPLAMTTMVLALALRSAVAAESVWKIDDKAIQLFEDKEKHWVISKSCRSEQGVLNCDAVRAARKASLSKAAGPHSQDGGANPGARVCETVGGEVVIAVDQDRNERSFCRFGDQSLIESGSLHYHAMRNDEKRTERSR